MKKRKILKPQRSLKKEEIQESEDDLFEGPLSIQNEKTLIWEVFDFVLNKKTKILSNKTTDFSINLSKPFQLTISKGLWPGFTIERDNQLTKFHGEAIDEISEWVLQLQFDIVDTIPIMKQVEF